MGFARGNSYYQIPYKFPLNPPKVLGVSAAVCSASRHICHYERQSDHSPVCPECGTTSPPIYKSPRLGTWYLTPLLHTSTATWLPLYLLMVRTARRHGVEQHGTDKPILVAIGLTTATLTAASFLAWLRRRKVQTLPLLPAIALLLLLAATATTGVVGAVLAAAYSFQDVRQ